MFRAGQECGLAMTYRGPTWQLEGTSIRTGDPVAVSISTSIAYVYSILFDTCIKDGQAHIL
jgi:hypothetical protein